MNKSVYDLCEAIQKAVLKAPYNEILDAEGFEGFLKYKGNRQEPTVYGKLNPKNKTTYLNLEEFLLAIEYSNYPISVLDFFGHLYGVSWQKLRPTTESLSEVITSLFKESSEGVASATQLMDPESLKKLSINDLKAIREEAAEGRDSFVNLIAFIDHTIHEKNNYAQGDIEV